MYRRHGEKLGLLFLAADLAVTAAIWLLAYFVRYAIWPAPYGVPGISAAVAGIPRMLLLAGLAYRLCGLYEVHRLRELPRELSVVCRASGLLFLMDVTAVFYQRDMYGSRLGMVVFLGLNAVALLIVRRTVWHLLKRMRRRGFNHGRAIVVGSGRMGRLVHETVAANPWTGLELLGFVDRPGRLEHARLPRLGAIEELGRIVAEHDADHVFVALPLSRYGELPHVYKALENLLVEVQVVPDVPNLAAARLRVLEIDGVPFMSLRSDPHFGWCRWAKRSMDLALGSVALVMAAPLMIVLAALVKLTSPGPVLFRQSRLGRGGRTFNILKFRSMRVDAEARSGPRWAVRNDTRCTLLGRFMRRWSLDELPQLFNVMAGDMSLVGPRPERPVFIARFARRFPNYAQRHQVHTGITGWAQINGWRGNTSAGRRLECDLYYIRNWSIWLDMKILVLTLWRGFRQRNAY